MLNLQDFLQNSPKPDKAAEEQTHQLVVTTSNTLKEISELKNEIIKLTQSLRVLKATDDNSPQDYHAPPTQKLAKKNKSFKEDQVKDQEVEESLAADKSMETKWWKLHRKPSPDNSPPRPQLQQPPQPEEIRDRDQLLNEKIQMFKEIKQRFTASQPTPPAKITN